MENFSGDRIPNLAGCVCTAFLTEASVFRGRGQNSRNAYYLQIGGNRWHRFRVNCMGVKWSVHDSPHRAPTDDWQFVVSPLEDVNVVGRRIERITYAEHGAREPQTPSATGFPQTYDESVICIYFTDGVRLEAWYHGHEYLLLLVHDETTAKQRPRQARRPRRDR